MKKRIDYINIAKAIGMIFVVASHAYLPIIREFGYMFMVPLFFFLNGVTFNINKKEINKKYLKSYVINRIKKMWIPFVVYSVIFIFLHNLFIRIGIYTNDINFGEIAAAQDKLTMWSGKITNFYDIKDFVLVIGKALTFGISEQLARPLWFIPALFIADVVYVALNFFCDKLKLNSIIKLIVVFFCSIIGYLTHLPRYSSPALISIILLYLGDLYKKYEEKVPINLWIYIISLSIVFIMSRHTRLNMMGNEYSSYITFLISSICGIYCVIFTSKIITKKLPSNNLIKKFLLFLGKNTLIVLWLHLLCFKIVTAIQLAISKDDIIFLACYPVYKTNIIWSLMYITLGLSIPLFIKKTKYKISNILNRR